MRKARRSFLRAKDSRKSGTYMEDSPISYRNIEVSTTSSHFSLKKGDRMETVLLSGAFGWKKLVLLN